MDNMKQNTYGRCHILNDWSDWDSSIHCDKAQTDRQGKAMTYPFTFQVDENSQTARFSSTSIQPYYNTTLSSCTCDDFQLRKLPCKHIYRLAVELGIIKIIRRPSFNKDKVDEIKKSSDIDNEPDQLKRQQSGMSSKCKPIEINYDEQTAIFSGSGKMPYNTTPDTCTCRDYFVRRLPCKHIYRLRYELSNRNS